LASRGHHHRQAWYECACCPTNLVRFLPSLGGYVYACSDNAVYVNLYIAGTGHITLRSSPVTITQETHYPWDGRVRLAVGLESPAAFGIHLRLPGWCEEYHISVDGSPATEFTVAKGYAQLHRTWQAGDAIELDLAMPIRRLRAHPRVEADAGRTALERGPIVYCLEGVDNGGQVRNLALPPEAEIVEEHRPDMLGGVTVLKGTALARPPEDWHDVLYRVASEPEQVTFVAVPYYAWDNRAPGEMVVWLPECLGLAEAPPIPSLASTSKASASQIEGTLAALSDGLEPARSNDHAIPRFTWWDHRGTAEWVQYEFQNPARVSRVEVYWFDDRDGGGNCRVPESWRLLYKDGEVWTPVTGASAYGIERDQYNRVTFDSVMAAGLRVEVQLRPRMSGGILEWRPAGD